MARETEGPGRCEACPWLRSPTLGCVPGLTPAMWLGQLRAHVCSCLGPETVSAAAPGPPAALCLRPGAMTLYGRTPQTLKEL
ncbi:unnamed protein product [Arctogadus glacialis]